ncbi:NAD(P)/FAD-dependent oxidoreductase [Chloroflexota bacterium]
MAKTAEVVIIGGGVIGCSIAYYLARKGVSVVVIEKKGGLSLGASGANQGGCVIQIFKSPILELAKESLKLCENLSEEIGYDIEYDNTGLLLCSVDEEQYPAVEEHVRRLHSSGVKARLIEGDKLREQEPSFGKDVVVGVEDSDSSIVNPFKLNCGFAFAAKKLGAEFLFSAEIKQIEVRKGSIASVVTDKEKISTRFVVNAAGAWSSEIGEMLGLTIPVVPRRGQIMVTESVPLNQKWRYICDADYLTTAFDAEAVKKSKDLRIRLGVAGGYAQSNTGNWTIGTSGDFAGYDDRVTVPTVEYLAKRAVKFMPRLKDVNVIRMFAGLRPFCYVDGLPILSKVDNPSGFIIATGHAGEGISLAPITGKLISELITENRTSMSIEPFTFSRFKTKKIGRGK